MLDDTAARFGYPMPSYIAAWKTYRTLSDEDNIIAKRLAHAISVGGGKDQILDVGPGDGRVLVKLLVRLNDTPAKVTVVEPNRGFLDETLRAINYSDFVKEIVSLNKTLATCSQLELAGHGIVTCTHTAYFLSHAEIETVLGLVREGATLYLVIDHPDSVFSRLWRRTAPRFSERVRDHLEQLRSLDRTIYQVSETTISAQISDPIHLRPSVRELVMSMLCYSETGDMTNEELASVQYTISSMSRDGRIPCDSLFFEISRRGSVLTPLR